MSLLPNLLCCSLCGRAVCLATLGPGWLRVFYQAHEVKQSLSSVLWPSPGIAGQDDISSEDPWLVYLCPCLFCMCEGRGHTCGSQKSAPDIILQMLSTLFILEQGLAVTRTWWSGRAGWPEDHPGPSSLYWGFNHTLPGPAFSYVLCGSNSAPCANTISTLLVEFTPQLLLPFVRIHFLSYYRRLP